MRRFCTSPSQDFYSVIRCLVLDGRQREKFNIVAMASSTSSAGGRGRRKQAKPQRKQGPLNTSFIHKGAYYYYSCLWA